VGGFTHFALWLAIVRQGALEAPNSGIPSTVKLQFSGAWWADAGFGDGWSAWKMLTAWAVIEVANHPTQVWQMHTVSYIDLFRII